jgi:hypothetical protein
MYFLFQEPEHLPDKQEENNWQPCVLAIHNFASAFLFSVETQHTIGYGTRQTTERCPEAIFLESLQSVVGVIIQVKQARSGRGNKSWAANNSKDAIMETVIICLLY